jgi:hypothetical protein
MMAGCVSGLLCCAATPEFEAPESGLIESSEGKALLAWSTPGSVPEERSLTYEVQQATDPDFSDARTIYQGRDQSTMVSGLLEGAHRYRVRVVTDADADAEPEWSNPLTVVVEYPTPRTVIILMTLGLLVAISTLVAVGIGSRANHAASVQKS